MGRERMRWTQEELLGSLPPPRRAHLIPTYIPNCESNEAAKRVTPEVTSYNLNYVN